MQMDEYVLSGVNVCQYAAAFAQFDEIFRWIQLSLALICSIVLLAYRIWKWHKDASKDGKIDKEEVDQLAETIKDGAEEIKSDIDNFKK